MIYLCQFGYNLAIGSKDRVQTMFHHNHMTLLTLKYGQSHQNLFFS